MKLKKWKRVLGLFLVLLLLAGSLPLSALAEEMPEGLHQLDKVGDTYATNSRQTEATENAGTTEERPDGTYDPEVIDVIYRGGEPSLTQDEAGNYLIRDVGDLNTLRMDLAKHVDYSNTTVIMTNDIDASGLIPYPIHRLYSDGNTAIKDTQEYVYIFDGTFNGMGYTIKNYTDSTSGLFDVLGNNCQIGNLTIETKQQITEATGSLNLPNDTSGKINRNIGIIANQAMGAYMTRCATIGEVKIDLKMTNSIGCGVIGSSIYLGSYLGSERDKFLAENCYSTVSYEKNDTFKNISLNTVSSGNSANCYYAGKITGFSVEKNQTLSIPFNSYRTNTDCYYDKIALGLEEENINSGGTGVRSSEMKKKSNFKNWDFNTIWQIEEGKNYPTLNRENTKLKARIVAELEIQLEPMVIDYNKISVTGELPVLRTNVKDIVVKNVEDNPYHLDVEFTAVKNGAEYVGVLGEHAQGVARFNDKNDISLSYDQNDEVDYFLPTNLFDKTAYTQEGNVKYQTATAWGSLTISDKTPALTETRKQELNAKIDEACEILFEDEKIFGKGEISAQKSYDPYLIFALIRSDSKKVNENFYDEYYKNIILKKYENYQNSGKTNGFITTDTCKDVMMITAIGYDPRDVAGYNLIDIITDAALYDDNKAYMAKPTRALAYGCYDFENDNGYDIKQVINDMAVQKTDATGVVQDGDENDVADMWSMYIQPIFQYYDPNAKPGDDYYAVKVRIENELLPRFQRSQSYIGSFWGGFCLSLTSDNNHWDIRNAWTNAQAQICLGMAGITAFDSRFVVGNQTMYDNIINRIDYEKRIGEDTLTSGIGPEQIIRGVTALKRAEEGKTGIYDCRDVKGTAYVKNLIDSMDTNDKEAVGAVWSAYQALSDGKKASMNQEDVKKLTDAVNGQGKALLQTQLEKANALKETGYTEETWKPFAEARDSASAVYANPKATDAECLTAYASLKNVMDALEMSFILGDVNGNGEVKANDAQMALLAANGKGKTPLTETQKAAADVNKDGVVKSNDAQQILLFANGRIKEFK